MNGPPVPIRSVEIPALERTLVVDSTTVSARCFLMTGPEMRYEIWLYADGDIGVVDVPGEESELAPRIAEAARCFAMTRGLWPRLGHR